ncbi:MAG: DUF3137 domain-containing protein [Tannerellaceae bacterium]|nr:DUF3137 domain-containing protein [Tannerellaceae bacterium]
MQENIQVVPEFEELKNQLHSHLEQVENMRKERRNNLLRIVILLVLFTGILSLICVFGYPEYSWTIVFAVIISLITMISLFIVQSRKVAEDYKLLVITPFVSNLIKDGVFSPEKGISEQTFIESGLFIVPDLYSSEDLITGKVGETSIAFSEVRAQERHRKINSKGQSRTYYTDIFKGFIFVADFPKEFRYPVVVRRTNVLSSKKNRVHLEDPEFEKCFNTYCTDQIEARYLLTPSIMSRIMDLERKFRGKNMMLSFRNSHILIAISDNTNDFEADVLSSVFNTVKLKREYTIIRALAGIVEDLNLNLRIWSTPPHNPLQRNQKNADIF